jgi:hypothetical protein
MPETVTFREDLGLIEVRSSGHVTKEEMQESRRKVSAIHQERGIDKVLVDARDLESFPGITTLFEFGGSFEEARLFRGLRLALVVNKNLIRDPGFIDTVARNRDVAMKVFSSIDEAVDWLTT